MPKVPACPVCGLLANGWINMGGEWRIRPGDLAVCIGCSAYLTVNVTGDGPTLRLMSDDELLLLPSAVLQRLASISKFTHQVQQYQRPR